MPVFHRRGEVQTNGQVGGARFLPRIRSGGYALFDLAEVMERAGRREEATAAREAALDRYKRKRNLAMVAQVRQRMGAGKGSAPLA